MSKFFKVLYYYYYLVYTKYIPDPSPRGTTVFVLGFSLASIIYPIIGCVNGYFKISLFYKNPVISIILPIIVLIYIIYFRKSIHKEITNEYPILFKSKKITVILVIGYTAFSMACLFIGIVLSRYFWENY
jgi:hypothetical protein